MQDPVKITAIIEATIGLLKMLAKDAQTTNRMAASKEFSQWVRAMKAAGMLHMLDNYVPQPIHFTTEEIDAYAQAANEHIDARRRELRAEQTQWERIKPQLREIAQFVYKLERGNLVTHDVEAFFGNLDAKS